MKSITKTVLVSVSAMIIGASAALAADQCCGSKAKVEKDMYPLKTCVVSGEDLGSMGKPYVEKYKDQEVRLCCKGCRKDFLKEPAKYMAKLDKAKKGMGDMHKKHGEKTEPKSGHDKGGSSSKSGHEGHKH